MQVVDYVHSKGDRPLHSLAQNEGTEAIRDEWEKGHEAGQYPSIDIPNSEGKTPLQLAALRNCNLESIKMLVDLGASLTAGDGSNLTPWHLAKTNSKISDEDRAKVLGYLRPS